MTLESASHVDVLFSPYPKLTILNASNCIFGHDMDMTRFISLVPRTLTKLHLPSADRWHPLRESNERLYIVLPNVLQHLPRGLKWIKDLSVYYPSKVENASADFDFVFQHLTKLPPHLRHLDNFQYVPCQSKRDVKLPVQALAYLPRYLTHYSPYWLDLGRDDALLAEFVPHAPFEIKVWLNELRIKLNIDATTWHGFCHRYQYNSDIFPT